METQTIDAKLLFARTAIENATNVEAISASMALFGYDADSLSKGMNLLAQVSDLHAKQKLEYGEQFTATTNLQEARTSANRAYMRHVKLARIALKNDRGAWETLQLSGDRKQSYSGWIQQAKTFYQNALASKSFADSLAKFAISTEDLNAGLNAINQVESLLSEQFKEKGEAQAATVARDRALDELEEWMADFIAIARIALEDQPQLIEMLGIVDKSSPSVASGEEEETLPDN